MLGDIDHNSVTAIDRLQAGGFDNSSQGKSHRVKVTVPLIRLLLFSLLNTYYIAANSFVI